MTQKVVVTGVTGSLGSHLAGHLLSQGIRVIGVSRGVPANPEVEHVAIDLANPDSVIPSFGTTPVINCAAITRDGWDSALERDTRQITASALALTAGPFVHISSSSVYDLTKPSVNQAEDDLVRGHRFLNSYGYAKWMAEEQVESSGLNAVILRPHAIYGDGDNTLLPRLRAAVRFGNLFLPGGGSALHAMTSMQNVAGAVDAALAALAGGLTGTTVVNVTDASPRRLENVIAEALGPEVRIRSVPVGFALAIAKRAEKRTPEGTEPRLSEYAVRQLAYERTYSLDRLRETLGFEPQ